MALVVSPVQTALHAEWYRYTKGRYSPVPHYLNCKRCHSVTQK